MADLKLTVDYSELVAAAKTTDQTKQAIRLLGQQFSRTGDQSAYMRAVNQIVASQKNLAVNARMSRGEIMKLANQYKQTTTFTDQLARAQMQLNAATQMSNKGLARSGLVMQQTGYQVGDFLVQVQSGTNVFVAFGQQATQLAGLLTMSFNPKIVALGVALSILIPLTTAVAAYFSRTGDAAKSSAEDVETLEDRLKSLDNTLKEYLRTREAARMGITAEELLGLEGLEEVRERLRASVKDIRDFIQAQYPGQDLADNFISQIAVQSEDYRNILGDLIEAETRLGEIRRKEGEEQFRTFSERLTQYQEEIKLQQTINKFGENSEEARQVRLEQAIAAEHRRIEALREAGELTDAQALSLQRSAEEAARLAAIDIKSGVDAAASSAAQLAERLGLSVTAASRLMAMGGGRGQEVIFDPRDPRYDRNRALMAQVQAETIRGPRPPERERTGVGATQQDYLGALQREANLKLKMLGLSEEEQRRLEIIFELTERGLPIEEGRIQSILDTEAALQKATEAEERRQRMMDSVQDHIEKGLMSLIDGSKSVEEAFRNTIRSILADIYQSAVIKPIASGISSFLFRESGGSMMPNRPYVVGERGPELVIPGRSSTVTNADLTRKSMGGSDAVVVNQTINVTGGTDPAAIRQEVAKLMPTITNATKTAVIDARRRGGQMRAAFQ